MIRGLDWMADGESLIIASTSIGSWNSGLWRLSLITGALNPVPCRIEWVENPTVSRSGKLVYENLTSEMNIWEVTREEDNRFGKPFISSTRWDARPSFSADGARVAFISTRSGASELWVCNADGSHLVQMTFLKGPLVNNPYWSPDGNWIAYNRIVIDNSLVCLIPSAGGATREITTNETNNRVQGWSSTGDELYFISDCTGEWQIWKQPIESISAIQVSWESAIGARISPDGTLLYFTKPSRHGLWRTPVERWQPKPLMVGLGPTGSDNWDVTEQGVYYLRRHRNNFQVLYYDNAGDSVRIVAETENSLGPGLSTTAGGTKVLMFHSTNLAGDLMILENTN